jgi:hypothetical protein
MIQSDSRVTGKLRSYGDRDKVQRYAVTDKELKNVVRYDENVAKYDDITKTQPQLWEQFKQPETLLPELQGQVRAT